MALRQRHTEGAILYEKKLKPFLKNLNEGKGTGDRGATCLNPALPRCLLSTGGLTPLLSSEPTVLP